MLQVNKQPGSQQPKGSCAFLFPFHWDCASGLQWGGGAEVVGILLPRMS